MRTGGPSRRRIPTVAGSPSAYRRGRSPGRFNSISRTPSARAKPRLRRCRSQVIQTTLESRDSDPIFLAQRSSRVILQRLHRRRLPRRHDPSDVEEPRYREQRPSQRRRPVSANKCIGFSLMPPAGSSLGLTGRARLLVWRQKSWCPRSGGLSGRWPNSGGLGSLRWKEEGNVVQQKPRTALLVAVAPRVRKSERALAGGIRRVRTIGAFLRNMVTCERPAGRRANLKGVGDRKLIQDSPERAQQRWRQAVLVIRGQRRDKSNIHNASMEENYSRGWSNHLGPSNTPSTTVQTVFRRRLSQKARENVACARLLRTASPFVLGKKSQ
jgi:hypothetical protein